MRVRRNEKSISINLSQERCSSDISFARSRLIEKSILQRTLRFPNFEKRKREEASCLEGREG